MKKLAIKGHRTRGREVIEILEMLGGNNTAQCWGIFPNRIYVIYDSGNIGDIDSMYEHSPDYQVYTLEQFLEKFPYRVGDKVTVKDDDRKYYFISKMTWNGTLMRYDAFQPGHTNYLYNYEAEKLQPYKERETRYLIEKANKQLEEIEKVLESAKEIIEEKTDTAFAPDLKGQDYSGKRFGYKMPNGYEFECVRKNEIILKPIEPKYPKTYKECCDMLNIPNDERYIDIDVPLDYNKSLTAFTTLIICRDAYWKIAGEQMGLDKPWKPDWSIKTEIKHVIEVYCNNVRRNTQGYSNTLLAFPIPEMCDAFYENFKELIELCKKLL